MKVRWFAAIGAVLLTFAGVACAPTPALRPSNTVVLRANGFDDPGNSYAWSMASFKGKLYVGTARYFGCVEKQTTAFYLPGTGAYKADPLLHCPADPYDMDLRAEIWQYDPATAAWTRVHQSTEVDNPRAAGKKVARDIGYRGMVVIGDKLYAGGVTADEYIPELFGQYPPELLSTSDGTNWSATDLTLPEADPSASPPAPLGTIHTPIGFQRPMGIRAMSQVNGQLFITASGGLTGDGAVVRVDAPESATPTFTQVSPPDMLAYELEPYNGQLYVGTGSATTGYGVSRLDTTVSPPSFVSIVDGGAGRGRALTSVVSMKAFKGKLYVGASGWYQALFPSSELISIAADDTWQLVTGAPRRLPSGQTLAPTSGFGDGFGNFAAAHFWRMVESGSGLYVGTNDWTWNLTSTGLYSWEYGFDVFGTCDGQFWWGVTRKAFGTRATNFGARTMEDLDGHYYVGSANSVDGTTIFRNDDVSPCAAPAPLVAAGSGESAAGVASTAPTGVPGRLLADPEVCGTVLSWDAQTGEHQYVVRRAERSAETVTAPRRPADLGATVPDVPDPSGGTTTGMASTTGEYLTIGTATTNTFVDRSADPTKEYVYEVSSEASNITGAVALAFSPARSAGSGPVTATDAARAANGLDVDGLRRDRDVESMAAACSK